MIDKLNASAQHATARARESVKEAQLRGELNHAYGELGRAVYALLTASALTQRLTSAADRVGELERELAALSLSASSSDEPRASAAMTDQRVGPVG
jgi:hypothetical protein